MAQSPSGIPSTNNSVMSITRSGQTEPFDLQVARGQIAGHQTVSIFGYQAAVTATSIPIWENATTYTFPTTATTLTCSSTSVTDVSPAAFTINGLLMAAVVDFDVTGFKATAFTGLVFVITLSLLTI